MGMFPLFPILGILFYLGIFIVVFILIYKWVTKIIALKEEQNELLREIIRKMGKE